MENTLALDNDKYLRIQKEEILNRISRFGTKLYLEFGGKLFDDFHASRVLPGFHPDSKLKLLLSLKDKCEIIMVINSEDIKNHKIRGDLGITYDVDVERLILKYMRVGLSVCGVVFSFYEKCKAVDSFMRKLKNMGIPVFKHYKIDGYPNDLESVVSSSGLGKNEYIKTTKPVIVVTAPGPGSGKMACCMSQLYHDKEHGINSGYAKYETFPIWNLPLKHPVNIAYESATVDLMDENMEDPYHWIAYKKSAVNYNRDVQAFPLVKELLQKINGDCPYQSPTDMGVNMVGYAIIDDKIACEASKQEIVRRYYQTAKDYLLGKVELNVLEKSKKLLQDAHTTTSSRKCVAPALKRAEETGVPCLSIQLPNGRIVVGKRSDLLAATSAALLNALKEISGIPDDVMLLQRSVIKPIQDLKVIELHNANPKIHGEEILIALAIQANSNKDAKLAFSHLQDLEGSEAHSSCILSESDLKLLGKLGIHVTEEPRNYIYKVSLT